MLYVRLINMTYKELHYTLQYNRALNEQQGFFFFFLQDNFYVANLACGKQYK